MPYLKKLFIRLACAALLPWLCLSASAVSVTTSVTPVTSVSDVRADALSLSARAAVLMDGHSGEVLYSHNADERLPMASTTKIMTALLALEQSEPDVEHSIPAEAVGVEGSSVYLVEGERLTLRELVYALMLESANDAATAIAIIIAGSVSAFADMMNKRAAKLGLENTHFENPHGLDAPEHYTTARELGKLTCAALENDSFREIVSTRKRNITFNSGEGIRLLVNHNRMLRSYDGAIGVKTGYTKKCGRCLVSAAERDGMRLVAVTLNAPDDWNDHTRMLDWGFSSYVRLNLAVVGSYRLTLPVCGGNVTGVVCSNTLPVSVTLPSGHGDISCTVEAPRFLLPPVAAGHQIGLLRYYCDGSVIASVPLVTESGAAVYRRPGALARWLRRLFGREYQ